MTDDKETGWTKISFRQAVNDLRQNGPTFKIGIAAIPFVEADAIIVLAQIDTGAHSTGISPQIARRLSLRSDGDDGLLTQAGSKPVVVPFYRVRLCFRGLELETKVVGLPFLGEPHDVVIGRDILGRTRLGIDFAAGRTWLHFTNPSIGQSPA